MSSPIRSGDEQRSALELVSKIEPLSVSVGGAGPTFIISHKPDASFMVVNDILAASGSVAFARDEVQTSEGRETGAFVVTGIGRASLLSIAQKYGVSVVSATRTPQTIPIHKARIGLYRPWQPSIDEGWTRWILEKYGFASESLYNAGVKAQATSMRASTPSSFPTCRRTSSQTALKPAWFPANMLAASTPQVPMPSASLSGKAARSSSLTRVLQR